MSLPQVRLAPSAVKRVRNFDCWVFRDELLPPIPSLPNGSTVELTDGAGTFLAYAFYSSVSSIAARVVSLDRREPVDRRLIAARVRDALRRRAGITGTTALRLVFSEADGLPGLIADRYGDYLILQIRTAGMEALKRDVVEELRAQCAPKGILERSDKDFREDEGLEPAAGLLFGAVPERIEIEEHGLRFLVDPYHGQKTGFYLDQRDTRRVVRDRLRPGHRVADVFAYTGAFGIAAAAAGAQVVCVEREEPYLALAREHAALNKVSAQIETVAGDAFYWVEAAAKRGDRFDWVLLDPPSLAKHKADTSRGRQALQQLVRHALGLLTDDGTLVVSVCTYHLLGLAEEIVRIAAADAGIRLRVCGMGMQASDHPWMLQMPMTRYLTSWFLQRDGSRAA